MPGVRVVVDPSVSGALSRYDEDRLEELIKTAVAECFELDEGPDGVGVEWAHPRKANNASPLGIEVAYSETAKLCPNETTREKLAERLTNLVTEYHDMPKSITEISAWILPHPGGVFKIAKRQA